MGPVQLTDHVVQSPNRRPNDTLGHVKQSHQFEFTLFDMSQSVICSKV